MNLDQYLTGLLPQIVLLPDMGFNEVFDHIDSEHKILNKQLLIYIDRILNEMVINSSCNVEYEHLHIEHINRNQADLISEFLVLKFFYLGVVDDAELSDSAPLEERIANLDALIARDIIAKHGSKGTSKIVQTAIAEKKRLKKGRRLFQELQKTWPNTSLKPLTLINSTRADVERLMKKFASYPFLASASSFNDLNSSYVVLNEHSIQSISKLKYKECHLAKLIKNVIFLNSVGKSEFSKFSLRDLSQFNQRSGTVFKKLLIITFNEQPMKFSRLRMTFDRIHSRYNSITQYPRYHAYTILPSEINLLTKSENVKKIPVFFFGSAQCHFWENVLFTINQYEGLEELRSSKMMDVYSSIFNTKTRDLIIDEIFDNTEKSTLITEGTKEALKEISEANILSLKDDLFLFFNWIIESGWPAKLSGLIAKADTIIISNLILKHNSLRHEISSFFRLSLNQKLTCWYDYNRDSSGHVLILDYVDLGPMPNTYKDNLIEYVPKPSQNMKGEFLAVFFEQRYRWSLYNFNKHLYNILQHPLRSKFFEWPSFYKRLAASKPDVYLPNYDLESKYENYQNHQSVMITTFGSRAKSFHSSELFIINEKDTSVLMAKRLEDLYIYDLSTTSLEAQCLTELYADFNIYEKMANLELEESELQTIRARYHLQENFSAKQLWKVLLRDQVDQLGRDVVYESLKHLLQLKNKQIVDKGHFVSVWMNPDSDTLLARGKSVFLVICDYLKLPKSYMRIMTRIYNSEKLNKSRSSRKMNLLLSDLINDGCFNHKTSPHIIISKSLHKYIKAHDLESIGISDNKMIDELSSLVELLRPQLKLTSVKSIEFN